MIDNIADVSVSENSVKNYKIELYNYVYYYIITVKSIETFMLKIVLHNGIMVTENSKTP